MKIKNIIQTILLLALSACGPVTIVAPATAPVSSLPDLAITLAYVSMVDINGRCLANYELMVTVINQGNVPATDVVLVETNTGHQIQVGTLDAFQSMTLSFPGTSPNGTYMVVADPQNVVAESNEYNNSAAPFEPTATPPASCPPAQLGNDATPTPAPFFLSVTPSPQVLDGLIYADTYLAQIWKISPDGQGNKLFDGIGAQLAESGEQAILELDRDLIIANSKDNSTFNITNTPDRLEIASRWWAANPAKVVFNSRRNEEEQENNWAEGVIGYLTVVNADGSEYTILDDAPSYTSPALNPDGNTIAYDRNGVPMLYEIGADARPFDPTVYGYHPGAESVFTSPSYSPDGSKLTWWVSEDNSQSEKQFSLVTFDLLTDSSSVQHVYSPLSGTLGWLPAPIWSPNGNWIAFQTRGEFTLWDLWVVHQGGGIGQHFGLATNPVWSWDSQHVAYAQWPPQPASYLTGVVTIIEVASWNTEQTLLPLGSIPLGWIP